MTIRCPQNTKKDRMCASAATKTLDRVTFHARNGFYDINLDKVDLSGASDICEEYAQKLNIVYFYYRTTISPTNHHKFCWQLAHTSC